MPSQTLRTFVISILLASASLAAVVTAPVWRIAPDGSVIVDNKSVSAPSIRLGVGSMVKPACTSLKRGMLWVTYSAAGVADVTEICAKLVNDSYAWSGVGAGSAPYSQTFSGQTAVTLAHSWNSLKTLTQCYDSSGIAIDWNTLTLTDANNSAVTFAAAQSGKCIVFATGGSGGGGSGGGGTGTVTATAGSLTADQPVFGAGAVDTKIGTKRGNTNQVQMTTGSVATNDCAKFDASGNVVSAGAPCGSGGGGGGGTVSTDATMTGDGSISTPLGVNQTVVPTRLSATATLTFAAVGQSGCNEQVIALVGAVVGDEVSVGAPGSVDQGFLWSGYVSIADVVTVRLCKITSGTVTPAAGVWRGTIVRNF